MTFEELQASFGSDPEKLIEVCRAAKVEIPLEERFYLKNHTPRKTKNNPEPNETEYVVVPSPSSSRELWVQRSDFETLVAAANTFSERLNRE